MNEKKLRKDLIELVKGGSAHITFEMAIKGINPEMRNFRPEPGLHSIFEELEHMRIAQEDIFRYMIEDGWVSPEWPANYWPSGIDKLSDEQWSSTLDRFRNDNESVLKLISDESIDLTESIPHAPQHTYLREIMLIADHNAYHLGKVVDIRKSLGDWEK
jgi:DinB superfamily